MADVVEVVEEHHDKLLRQDDAMAKALVLSWAASYQLLLGRLAELIEAVGDSVTLAEAQRVEQFEKLVEAARLELIRNAKALDAQLRAQLPPSVSRAVAGAVAAVGAAGTDAKPLPAQAAAKLQADAVEHASPLAAAMAAAAPLQAAAIAAALVRVVSDGRPPREAARTLRRHWGRGLTHSLTIARTELLRTHREATGQTYRANSVRGYVWHAELDDRTCAVCWSMHGTKHRTSEVFGTHPNCRCAMVPDVDGLDHGPTGAEQFAALPTEQQRRVLGPGALQAYQDGLLTLDEDSRTGVVATYTHPRQGTGRKRRPLRELAG